MHDLVDNFFLEAFFIFIICICLIRYDNSIATEFVYCTNPDLRRTDAEDGDLGIVLPTYSAHFGSTIAIDLVLAMK